VHLAYGVLLSLTRRLELGGMTRYFLDRLAQIAYGVLHRLQHFFVQLHLALHFAKDYLLFLDGNFPLPQLSLTGF
jgi:hypothetical protein